MKRILELVSKIPHPGFHADCEVCASAYLAMYGRLIPASVKVAPVPVPDFDAVDIDDDQSYGVNYDPAPRASGETSARRAYNQAMALRLARDRAK